MIRTLRILFFNNFANKLIALALAVGIWTIVSFEVEGTYERDGIAVEIVPVKDGVHMQNIAVEPPQVIVSATFTAPRRIGQQHLSPAVKVRAVHRIENPAIGERDIEINRRDFDLPYDVKLKSVEPESLNVTLRLIITRKLPVEVVTKGAPAKGYELTGKPFPEPTEVSVRGPKDVLKEAYSIPTEPVDIEGRSSSFSSDYPLVGTLNDRPVQTHTKVRVRVNIRPVEIVRKVRVPVHVNLPLNYKYKALLPKAGEGGVFELSIKGPELLLNEPGLAKKLRAFVIVTPKMKPRPGIYYAAKVHLFVPPELAELKLAGEYQEDLEIREHEKQKPKKKEKP